MSNDAEVLPSISPAKYGPPHVAPMAGEPDESPPQRTEYWARLRERCDQWGQTHAVEYAELVARTRSLCDIPEATPWDLVKPAKQRVVDAIVHETIRIKNGWPGEDQWNAQQRVKAQGQ